MEFRVLEDGYSSMDGLFVLVTLLIAICVYSVICIIVNTFHLLYLKRVKMKIRKDKVLPSSAEGENSYHRDKEEVSTYNIYAKKKKLF